MKGWQTIDEINFVRKLGTRFSGRAELLSRYLEGCAKRERWDTLNKDKILITAQRELARERALLVLEKNTFQKV